VDSCEGLSDVLDDAASLARRLESARVEIQDVAETLADYDANLQADPAELDSIEARLDQLYALQNRFKVDSVAKLIKLRMELEKKLSMLEDSSVTLADLEAEVKTARNAAEKAAAEITASRRYAATEFSAALHAAASPLGMANLSVVTDVIPENLSSTGGDKVEFRFAFNKNQTPVTVDGTASGGEVSRLMLSIKSIMAGRLLLPTIIFDEVDTGVSGDVANRMAMMMRDIANNRQVVTITHLPQVAAKGHVHFKVYKEDDETATHTRIRSLSASERRSELALMLSGTPTDATALAAADTLLNK
ncbi:MAG: DNA repair protein RecN, partial [Muribaculaceae bacterium]|nr:DNA repair protein RecN [Muribaculaceae bacterium]